MRRPLVWSIILSLCVSTSALAFNWRNPHTIRDLDQRLTFQLNMAADQCRFDRKMGFERTPIPGFTSACDEYAQLRQIVNTARKALPACQAGDPRACGFLDHVARQMEVEEPPPSPVLPPGGAPGRAPGQWPSSGSGGGGRGGEDCSLYSEREANCGKDCTFMNPYHEDTSSTALSQCHERAAQCRREAAAEFNRCVSRGR